LEGRDRNRWGIGATIEVETESGKHWRTLSSSQGYASANAPLFHFGLGPATGIKRMKVTWPRGEVQLFSNLPVNGRFLIRQPKMTFSFGQRQQPSALFEKSENALPTGLWHKENVLDDYSHQPLLPYRPSRLGPGLSSGDVDGDGQPDLFVGQGSGSAPSLLLASGDGTFSRSAQKYFEAPEVLPFEDMGSVFFDADSDGDLDLYVVSGGYGPNLQPLYLRDRLYLNNAKGVFGIGLANTPNLRDSGGPVCAADFDRDGDLDLFVGGRVVRGKYPETPSSALLLNQGGKFTDVTEVLAPGLKKTGMVTSSLWSDYDGDGWTDLVLTTEWGPVEFWKNEKGKLVDRTLQAGTADRLGWWTSLAHGDFDNDGDLDYAVGNMGLNTKYRASRSNPYFAYWGDLDGSGRSRFVEACKENGHAYPLRGKSCSTRAIPSLAKKFTSFHTFAQAGLSEIYEPRFLNLSRRFEINELASGLLINSGHGEFAFRKLPRLAQTSPLFGMTLTDFNGDGFDDLAANQNFFPMQPETGRLNGGLGLLMLGDGKGAFRALMERESGILLPGDGRALVVEDINGDHRPDLLASANLGPLSVFINKSKNGVPLCLKFSGGKGNLRAAGSRVFLNYQNGRRKLCQLTLGSSHLSAPDPHLFVVQLPGNPIESVTILSPLGKESTHSLTGKSGLIRIPVVTR